MTCSSNFFNMLSFGVIYVCLICGCSDKHSNNNNPVVNDSPETATLTEKIDRLIQNSGSDTDAGVAVLVVKDGEVAYRSTRGMANIAQNIPIDHTTGFRLASVSKSFTALAVMLLYEQQLINLDDAITTHLPELPAEWSIITVHHLLSHRSGIPDFVNDVPFSFWPLQVTDQLVMNYLISGPALEFIPGETQQYSNSGFFLLAQIVSRVSGLSFPDYMSITIFAPAGMNNSYIFDEMSDRRDTDALSYGDTEVLLGKLWLASGASGQVSSLDDFESFFLALTNNNIVSEETFELMTTAYSFGIFGHNYGYGFFLSTQPPLIVGHDGLLGGFMPVLRMHTEKQWQLIILNNNGSSSFSHQVVQTVDAHYNAVSTFGAH